MMLLARTLTQVEDLLRGRSAAAPDRSTAAQLTQLFLLTTASGMVYGAVMGSYGGFTGDRLWQVVISAVKVPLLLQVTFALGLPAWFLLNTLMGLRSDFGEAFRALIASQATLTVVLASLSPYVAIWYLSVEDYPTAVLFNGICFAIASVAAQAALRQRYRTLLQRQPRHRWSLRIWLVLYVFVGIQMAWVLRPFVGQPGLPAQFFRDEAWDNAYVIVGRLLWDVASGR